MDKFCTVSQTRLEADCGSENEILIAKLKLKLNKVEETTKLFSYDLSQTPYYYTVEVTNGFKGLDIREGLPEELWT